MLRLYAAHMLCKSVRNTVNHAHRKHMVVSNCTLFRVHYLERDANIKCHEGKADRLVKGKEHLRLGLKLKTRIEQGYNITFTVVIFA